MSGWGNGCLVKGSLAVFLQPGRVQKMHIALPDDRDGITDCCETCCIGHPPCWIDRSAEYGGSYFDHVKKWLGCPTPTFALIWAVPLVVYNSSNWSGFLAVKCGVVAFSAQVEACQASSWPDSFGGPWILQVSSGRGLAQWTSQFTSHEVVLAITAKYLNPFPFMGRSFSSHFRPFNTQGSKLRQTVNVNHGSLECPALVLGIVYFEEMKVRQLSTYPVDRFPKHFCAECLTRR